jgi:hypothetical protein
MFSRSRTRFIAVAAVIAVAGGAYGSVSATARGGSVAAGSVSRTTVTANARSGPAAGRASVRFGSRTGADPPTGFSNADVRHCFDQSHLLFSAAREPGGLHERAHPAGSELRGLGRADACLAGHRDCVVDRLWRCALG